MHYLNPQAAPGPECVRFRGEARLVTDRVVPIFGSGNWLTGSRRVAVLDTLGCSIAELIEPVSAGGSARSPAAAGGGQAGAGVGQLRPKRARITGTGR